jgi:hypothetical protein
VQKFDETSNYSHAQYIQDEVEVKMINSKEDPEKIKSLENDVLQSEIFELKNMWFTYSKKINSILVILPQEMLNKYDMVAKSLQPPIFDLTKYPEGTEFQQFFNEIVYKMSQHYFSVF